MKDFCQGGVKRSQEDALNVVDLRLFEWRQERQEDL